MHIAIGLEHQDDAVLHLLKILHIFVNQRQERLVNQRVDFFVNQRAEGLVDGFVKSRRILPQGTPGNRRQHNQGRQGNHRQDSDFSLNDHCISFLPWKTAVYLRRLSSDRILADFCFGENRRLRSPTFGFISVCPP